MRPLGTLQWLGGRTSLGLLLVWSSVRLFFGQKMPKGISFLYRSWALQSKKAGKILEGSSWKVKQGCFLGRLMERRRGTPFLVRTNTKAAFCCCRIISHLILWWQFCIMREAQVSTRHIRRQCRNTSFTLVKWRHYAFPTMTCYLYL